MTSGSDRHLILVVGTARSGSTALDLLLGDAFDGISCGEIYAAFRPVRRHHLSPRCRCGADGCDHWSSLDRSEPRSAHRGLLDRHGRRVLVDSSKNLVWAADSVRWAHEAGIRPTLLLTWKTPADLARSWRKQLGDQGVVWGVEEFVRYHRRFLSLGSPFVSVRNRDVVDDPLVVIERIGRLLGIRPTDGERDPFGPARHLLFGSDAVVDSPASLGDEGPEGFESVWGRVPGRLLARAEGLATRLEGHDVHRVLEAGAARVARRPRLWQARGRLASIRQRRRLNALGRRRDGYFRRARS